MHQLISNLQINSIIKWQQIHKKIPKTWILLTQFLINLIQPLSKLLLKSTQHCGKLINIKKKNSDKIWIILQTELSKTIFQIKRCLKAWELRSTITELPIFQNIQMLLTEEEFSQIQNSHRAERKLKHKNLVEIKF